jgi:undecaprenyl-diphosphatase
MPFRYLVELNIISVGIITLLSVGLFFLLMKLSYKIKKETYDKFKTVTLICFIGIISQLTIIYLMKIMWSRVRFFELDENFGNFTRWYIINWFEGTGTSFPSGHTSGATNIMYLTLFAPLITDDKKKHVLVEGLCFLFIALTAISRMVLGVHYLSDVTAAFAITYVLHIIVSKSIIDRQKRKKSI